MAMDPTVQRMTPRQRERWAWGFVVVLALIALLWGLKVYYLPFHEANRPHSNKPLSAITSQFRDGDIIFQTSTSAQSKAIQQATGSQYSHCGLLFQSEDGGWYVLEAVQPVKQTPLASWVRHGVDDHFVVKRLKSGISAEQAHALHNAAAQYIGKDYDALFGWGDERIYCSELVWKAYKNALGISLAEPRPLRSFNLSTKTVAGKLRERYGDAVPLDEPVISPAAIFESVTLSLVAKQ